MTCIELFCLQNFTRKEAAFNNGTQCGLNFVGYLFEQSLHHRRFKWCVGLPGIYTRVRKLQGLGVLMILSGIWSSVWRLVVVLFRFFVVVEHVVEYVPAGSTRDKTKVKFGYDIPYWNACMVWYGFEKVWKNLKSEQHLCSHGSQT